MMASGTSSLESNGSTESISHSYVSNERHNTTQLPIEYEVLSASQCYDKPAYTHTHTMSAPYELGQYDVIKQQANESLKQQCEKALHDLNQLRRQHSETSRRCEHVMKELEYFRGQHRAAMNQLEVSAQEASSLRGKYGDLLNDNQRLEREVQHLQQSSGAEGSDALVHTLRKYDALKEEFDCFQKSSACRYDDLIENHNTTLEKLQIVQEENSRLKTQCHELTQERNAVIRERNALKQQVASVVRQWEGGGVRERADIKRLTDERNAAMAEYTLIMSERDTVHKEMEKLSDDLQAALKRVAALESALQASREEQRATALQAESLRREIESALVDRDRAIKECTDLKTPQNTATLVKSRQDNSAYHHLGLSSGVGNDGFLNGQHSNDPSMDKLQGLVGMVVDAVDKERVDNLEQANQEIERLRKQADRLQAELNDAQREAEVSKRRRDWAFSERDKLLQERESVKALCNRLRKERDQMVGELAEARRHNKKESKDGKSRSKHEDVCRLPSPAPAAHPAHPHLAPHGSHRHSTDVQDFEWEIIDVELSSMSADGSLGLELCGGRDEPCYPNDCSVYVTAVKKGSIADGRVKVLDRIAEVCGVSQWARGSACAAALRAALARGPVPLRLQRARAARTLLRIAGGQGGQCGLTLQHGIFIGKIACGSAAAKESNLYVGDRVVSINNRSLEGVKSASEATALLNDCQYDCVLLTVLRPLYPCCDPRNRSLLEAAYPASSAPAADEPWRAFLPPAPPHEPKVHIEHGVPDFDRRYVYHVAAGSQGKIHQERGTWDMIGGMIRGKIEQVTGGKNKDKQNKVPESDAIAELDSVIDSYHGKTIKETSSVLKRSRRKNKEAQNDAKNGGTWPKARANFILEDNATGTIVQPRSRKERPPLSILLSPPTKLPPEPQRSNANRNSNPIPLGHVPLTQVTAPARHSVYKSIESSPAVEHFPKPAPLAIHNPFAPPSMNFDKNRTLEKDKISISDYEQDVTPNRLSLVLNPSDDSLFYQPAIRNRTKSPHSLDFMVNKGPNSLDFVTRKSPSSLDHSIKNHSGKDILDQYYSSKKSSSPKTVNKYPSDSDSFGPDSLNSNANFPMTGTLPTQSRLQSQYYRGPFTNSNPHNSSRYTHLSSPTNIPQSQSGESIGTTYDMHSFTSHTHNMSDLNPVPRVNREYQQTYEGGTFPRKKENQRFRIPSNPSVTSKNSAGKLSTGSIERSSERNSPMPTFHVEVLSPGRGAKQLTHKGTRNSMPEYCGLGWNKPLPGELRRVHIDKSQQPLGIQIYCPPSSGGVFVSTVNDNSLASQVGLQIGDQLLEVCGINMRSATYTLAASVLRQIGNSITMLVQYSPEKYKDEMEVPGSSSSGESSHDEEVSLSGSPTPRNSPGPQQSLRMDVPSTDVATLRQSQGNKDLPRFLLIEMRNCSDLGISLVGGNAVGIFVHSVQIDSPAYIAGLRTGDQILEYNNVDLRRATAEQAALELAKPADKVSVLVRHDLQQYHEIKDKPGDAFYIRAGFDRCTKITSIGMDTIDEYSLWFRKDEVLFVDNTLFNGAPGLWRAWQLDFKGVKRQWGTIPSKFKVEEILRRSIGTLDNEAQRRASSTARRSFFRRKKHRDSKELASFSNTELGCWSDSGTLADDAPPLSYQRVERLHCNSVAADGSRRPVAVLGPLRDCVAGKLVTDWPHVFARARPDPRALRDLAEKGIHCIVDVSVPTIEKLHKHQIYPIVLFIKFKSFKQIKEVKDTRYPADKVSAKAAKEMYEHGLKVENEYRNYISAEIPAGVNIAYMCTQIKEAVEEEQNKTLWVPSAQA
ncbi:disks large homolog 5 isoform X1 [Maniola jurtina]|uniref:disks large homolog 5 isoform X1 n=1 Tax=Maniola jurtina TaxID=191418 RepID=UPI001E68F718|nr:disks large homolog 5 isoform X1 [Maniola jurtina]XP_045775277.1 disks large homolog 5 isoform X1 [Maniola jurtina]XP_045775278.1 disks large homolog 5 isoform X1 [Maniola jurtina]XP_045775279.1 disks large homolog 5 isoform X1 [Maniola jurtina]